MFIEYYRQSLIDLCTRVQEMRSHPLERRGDCLAIQQDLLRRVTYVEKKIKTSRLQIKELKGMLKGKGPARLSKSDAQQMKKRIERNHQTIEEYREILYLFKSIGDALAFIYIPKWDIKPMAFKEDAGHMHGKKGLRQELAMLRRVFEVDGALAILNDLTNSLRYGDLTIVSKGFCGPVEVKSGRYTSRRDKRQRENLENMNRYLVEDRTEGLYGIPGETVRSDIVTEERNHVDDLNKLIEKSYKDGFAFSKIEEGLYYYVVDGGHAGSWDFENDSPSGFQLLLDEFDGKQPMLFFINRNKFSTQGRFPYTLSIRDPQALFDFYCGWLHVNVIVEVETMSARFVAHGLKMNFVEDEDVALSITNTDPNKANERFDTLLSRHYFERLAYEFLSLDWFVEENVRRADFSTFTDHELSAMQVVTGAPLEDLEDLLVSRSSIRERIIQRMEIE